MTDPERPAAVADLRQRFLDGMGCAACTVNVVTTDGPAGRGGVTVSAMASVSADGPAPTLIVCVNQEASAAPVILANGVFCVNVLRDDQTFISDTFAGRTGIDGVARFACASWAPMGSGAPRVVEPVAAFDCKVLSAERVGTHYVFLGEVCEIFMGGGGNPLIYANRAYGVPARLPRVRPATPIQGQLRIGCLHTFGPYVLPGIIEAMRRQEGAVDLALVEGDQRVMLEALRARDVDLVLVYELGLGDGLVAEPLAELSPYVLLAEADPLAANASIALAALVDEPMVLLDAPPSSAYFLSMFEAIGAQARVDYRVQTFEMVRGFVGHGLGYSLLATKPASSVSYDGRALVTRPLVGVQAVSRMVLVRRAGEPLAEPAAVFARHCRGFFGRDAAPT